METKNLNDQNPEPKSNQVQEEKSLTDKESASESTKKTSVTVKATKKKTQIDDVLRQKIILLFRDGIKSPKPPVKKIKKSDKKVTDLPQISEEERDAILSMLMDTVSNSGSDYDTLQQDDIDYEHINKQELVELLEEVVEEKDVTKIKRQIAQIKAAFYHRNKEDIDSKRQDFIAEGGNEEEFDPVADPLEIRFNNAFAIYRHNKAKYSEELERQKQANLSEKHNILEELKELINSEETLKKTYDHFQELQEKWKNVGMVPASEYNNLWQNYHFLVERFFDKVRINKELRDLDLKKNLEQKLELCEKAEELLEADPNYKTFKLLQKYHDEWREIGPVPRENNEEIWERFKEATDKINQRRRDHYKNLQDEQKNNYEAKKTLCEQIEKQIEEAELNTIKQWERNSEKINDLMKQWKTIGRAPKSQNDEIWDRFKSSLDLFYEKKRAFFNELKKQQMENYNLKLKICEKAESIQESNSWRSTTDELINLQKEWKNIGPVPRKYSDKIWKRFRTACDIFFDHKAAYYKARKEKEEENLKKKQDILDEMNHFTSKPTKEENLEAMRDFQKRWEEIGHVLFKEKDRIQNTYREASNNLMKKLSIYPADLNAERFKNKLQTFKNTGKGEQQIIKERSFIYGKIKKLESEIILLENNIGFFSDSKKSNVLKEEFEKKIDQAKKELDLLNERLRLIDKELS